MTMLVLREKLIFQATHSRVGGAELGRQLAELFMAPSSQELEPPQNLGRFRVVMRLMPLLLVLLLLSACTRTHLKVVKPTEGPKALHVVLVNDPLLITIELKSVLQQNGIDATFSSEEVRKETIIKESGDKSVVYKSSTDSPYRYQMSFSYAVHPQSNLVTAMVAQVWDADKKEIIAKYSVRNLDWYLDAEEASERLYEDFISKLFQ